MTTIMVTQLKPHTHLLLMQLLYVETKYTSIIKYIKSKCIYLNKTLNKNIKIKRMYAVHYVCGFWVSHFWDFLSLDYRVSVWNSRSAQCVTVCRERWETSSPCESSSTVWISSLCPASYRSALGFISRVRFMLLPSLHILDDTFSKGKK